ncbi:Fes1 domain-containing protein [Rhizoctonia solani AG-1 IA]|uniref:Fes1 domain-containing protein n=1 Tax=Thanatephorus cucumeris (strain AG1-IA) TaxID=983506 RepID=L8WL05_THACA|nr:Fes1 domain-containing protein [Rhizoctonia solani AG-1 IA]
MESLLKWSLENTPTDEPVVRPTAERMKELDPEIIDMILGKSDAVVMKEKLAIARDESREEDERVEALDDFEMLVEQIDNANSEFNGTAFQLFINERMHRPGESQNVGALDRAYTLTRSRRTAACDMDCRYGGSK